MTTLPDIFMAQLVLDYLSTPESAAKGVPAIEKLLMDSCQEYPRPSLIIAAREDPKQSSGSKRVVMVTPVLATWLKSTDENAVPVDKQTTRPDASAWLHLIDNRLRDLAAFAAFVAALPSERKAGYAFLCTRFGGAAVPLRGEITQEVSYATSVSYTLAVSPLI